MTQSTTNTENIDHIKELASKAKLIVIAGATCTGKTGLSIDLAQNLNAEIINADSRLVFKDMNIGTAKPDACERAGIKHHLIDILEANQIYSSGEYRKDFDLCLEEDQKYIVVGGTGMYLRAALENLEMPEVHKDDDFRAELENLDLSQLCKELEELDREALTIVDLNNKRRVIRALEVIKLSGKKFSEQYKTNLEDRHEALWIGIKYQDRSKLYELIDKRVHVMIEMGLIEEVKTLFDKYGETKTLSNTIGYGEIISHLKGELSLDDAIALIQKKSRNYAKRQYTWFNANPRIHWILK